jgi:hypothetical protein
VATADATSNDRTTIACVFLWRSPTWTDREKLIGTFALPGGIWTIALAAMFLGSQNGENDPVAIPVLLLLLALQLLGLITLWRRAWISR